MNPHAKEDWFLRYLEVKAYKTDRWHDTELCVKVGGLGLVICTISTGTGYNCSAGFRIVDENDQPLLPYRKKINSRHSVHFSSKPSKIIGEDQNPVTFHMIANCQYAKLQVRPTGGGGYLVINRNGSAPVGNPSAYAAWNHKTISTMTAISLVPNYQPGANTIFTYPQSRMPRRTNNDKPPVIHKDKITSTSSGGPSR